MATGAGRQLAAQHSHSLEAWYAHIPGIKVLAPATLEDARGMLWTALQDPDPIVIFEHVMLYNMAGRLASDAGAVDIEKAAIRREGRDISLVTYGGSLLKTLEAASLLAAENIDAEVIDLRTLRPLDDATVMASVRKTRRAVIVDEGWRSGSLAAEVGCASSSRRFGISTAPSDGSAAMKSPSHMRVTSRSQQSRRFPKSSSRQRPRSGELERRAMAEFRMPSLGADMEAGTLVEWMVKPGDKVSRGDIVAVVETQKGAIEIEVFEAGEVEEILVPLGTEVPVGMPLARIRGETEAKIPTSAPKPCAPMPPAPAKPAAPKRAPPPPTAVEANRASPAARQLAHIRGIDLTTI